MIPRARTSELALLTALVGGSLIAFRWPTAVGNLSISRVGALMVVMLVARDQLTGGARIPAVARPVLGSLLLLFTVAWVSLIRSPDLPVGIVQFGNLIEAVTLLLGCFFLVDARLRSADRDTAARFAALPLIAFLPSGLLGLYQAFQLYTGQLPSIPLVELSRVDSEYAATRTLFNSGLNRLGLDRVAGATGDPPTFGILCAVAVLYAVWLHQQRLGSRPALTAVACALGGAGVIFSASASALAVGVFGLFLLLVPSTRRLQVLVRVGAGTVVVLLLALFVPFLNGFYISAVERIAPLLSGEGTASDHLALVQSAWNTFLDHPVLGTGSGGLLYGEVGYSLGFSSVHNTYLLQLAEAGLVGGAALMIFLVTVWRHLAPRLLFVACCSAWLVYLDVNRLPYLWAALGVASGVAAWAARAESTDEAPVLGQYASS